MTLQELVVLQGKCSKDHGFWDKEREFGDIISLMHTELSEAYEEYRTHHAMTEVYFTCQHPNSLVKGSVVDPRHDGCDSGPESSARYCRFCDFAKPEGIPIELADVVLRVADACAYYGIDLETAVQMKLKYNQTRSYMHGGKKT